MAKSAESKPAYRPHHTHHADMANGQVAEVSAILGRPAVQAKLSIGTPGDRFEQEADRVAAAIVAQPAPTIMDSGVTQPTTPIAAQAEPVVQRLCTDCEEELQLKSDEQPVAVQQDVGPYDTAADASSPPAITPPPVAPVVQLMCDECEEEVQLKQDAEIDPGKDEELIQTAAVPGHEPHATISLETQIASIRRGGKPMDSGTRDYFEPRLGYDFSQTHIHNDHRSHSLAADMGARAFTHGNHIVFGAGEYSPGTQTGRKLLAHELTHVIQQGAASPSQTVTRLKARPGVPQIQKGDTPAAEGGAEGDVVIPNEAGDLQTGQVNRQNATITWDSIDVPTFKYIDHRRDRYNAMSPLKRGRGERVDRTGDNNPEQRTVWAQGVSKDNIRKGLEDKLKAANAGEMPEGNTFVFEVRAYGGNNRYYYGTLDGLATEFQIPTWGGEGRTAAPNYFHVDHIVELQLAEWPHRRNGNNIENMELLDGDKNQDSGEIIMSNILAKINGFIRATDGAYGDSVSRIKGGYTLIFNRANGTGRPSVGRVDYWKRDEIAEAKHLNAVVAADPTKIGGPGLVRVFSKPRGGVSRRFSWSGNTTEEQAVTVDAERNWIKPFVVTHKYFNTDSETAVDDTNFGYLKFHVPEDHEVFNSTAPEQINLTRFQGARYGGKFPEGFRSTLRSKFNAKHTSPVVFDEIDIDGDVGIVATGNINVTLPFFSEGTQLGIRLENGDMEIFKEFSLEDISVPQPFAIDQCSVMLAYRMRDGWRAVGSAHFRIENLGAGSVSIGIDQQTGFYANGEFNVESTLFNPATITVGYRDDAWSFGGTLGFQSGLIPGINSGNLNVAWNAGVLSGSGQVDFAYPWLESGTMEFSHSEAEGTNIETTVGLSSAVPGLRSGSVTANVSRNPEGIWSLGGSVTGNIDTSRVPGITNAVISGEIRDGIFTASVTTDFERNIARGDVTLGVTNQALDDNGQPVEGQSTEELVFYGSGNVTLQLTPWLAANAGVNFARDGGVSINGGIEVTEDIEILTDEQTPDYEIPRARRPGFDVNIPLASIGVADVALDLSGELNAYLRTSPLVLTDVYLNVFYDFDDPNATTVEGNARLHMDAQAGLEGALGLGLSARVLVLRGGGQITLTVGAELDGNIDLVVHPEWNIQDGFAIDADLNAIVQPVLFVGLAGNIYVEIDALIGSVDIWESDPLNIADKRLPLNIRVGATANAHYQEKPRSEFTLSGIQWVIPTAGEMRDALVDAVLDEV